MCLTYGPPKQENTTQIITVNFERNKNASPTNASFYQSFNLIVGVFVTQNHRTPYGYSNFPFSAESNFWKVNILNQWAEAIENLDHGNPGSEKSFGMKQRPDGDIEIDEKFWEEDFIIPTCQKCNGVLKPDVGHLSSFS